MTINSPAAPIFAMFVAQAEKAGVDARPPRRHPAERHPEGVPGAEGVRLPAAPVDASRPRHDPFTAAEMPRWHSISISGYHIREAGSTAVEELAFTLANGFAYVELALQAGLPVDAFAPRLSFFFNAHIDFFEEIAKYRAARRIWARWMHERYGAERRALDAAALPHPDRRRVAHRAAARGQHRAHGDRGARRRARRHPEPAHQLDGRGARPADREGGPHRAAHPAGHRPRDQRRPRGRSARRLVLRRGADRRDGAPGRGDLRPPRRARRRVDARRRHHRRSRRTGSRARSPTRPTSSSGSSTPAAAWSSASTGSPRATTTTDMALLRITNEDEARQLKRLEAVRQDRDNDAVDGALATLATEAADPEVNLMPTLIEAVEGLRHARRDDGHAGRRVRPPRRSADDLAAAADVDTARSDLDDTPTGSDRRGPSPLGRPRLERLRRRHGTRHVDHEGAAVVHEPDRAHSAPDGPHVLAL